MTALTVLVCQPGFRAAKLYRATARDDYDAGMWFTVERWPCQSFDDLARALARLATDPTRFLVRGEPTDFADLTRPRRRTSAQPPAEFRDVPTPLLWLDLDKLDFPWSPDDLPATAHRLRTLLGFPDAPCHVQLSAGAHPDKPLRAHVAFWLSHPVDCVTLRQWAKSAPVPVDDSLFTPVQPHYTADPLFTDGAEDPIRPHPRSTTLPGHTPPTIELPLADLLDAPDRYQSIMQTLGDGPRLKGFHDVLLRAVAAYVRGSGTAFESLKQDIRARVERAPKDRHSPEYLENLTSDRTLDALIASARAKFTPTADALFTPQEVESFGPDILRRLILQHGNTRYIFDPNGPTWIPTPTADARTALRERCARFPIAWTSPDGRLKRLADIEHEHGSVLTQSTLYDLNASLASLETLPHGLRLRLPTGRPTFLPEPEYSPAVDAWIETLSRPDIVRIYLRDFLRFDLPLFVLLLTGEPSSGKSSFARALTSFWCRGWVDLTSLLPSRAHPAPWTADLLECPFTVAPEGLPPRTPAAALRSLVGDAVTAIRRKYTDDAHLLGFLRVLVVANPDAAGIVLDDGDDENAFAATAARFQHVKTTPASVQAWDYRSFVVDGALVRHAAHLALQPIPADRPRFGAHEDPTYTRQLALASDAAQAVLGWLLLALAAPGATKVLPRALERAHAGLRLTAADVHAEWRSYPQAVDRPSLRALRAAWRVIAPGDIVTRETIEEHCHATGAAVPLAVARIGEVHLTAAQ